MPHKFGGIPRESAPPAQIPETSGWSTGASSVRTRGPLPGHAPLRHAGERLSEIESQRVAMIENRMRESAHYHYDGSTEWAALLRKLERKCPDYRT